MIEYKALIQRLSPVCLTALEVAVNQCTAAHNNEVTIEHLMLALLDNVNSDVALIINHYNLDPLAIRRNILITLSKFRTDNIGRPVFSTELLVWMQDAWTISSTEYNHEKIRSGALFAVLSRNVSYANGLGSLFGSVDLNDLKKNINNICLDSSENESVRDANTSAKYTYNSVDPNSALGKYCIDYTGRARAGLIDPIFGREREIRQIIDILARRRKNNPIIVGDSGVGKTALVEGLALLISQNAIPPILQNTDIMGLDLGLLQAGASVKGEFENRLKNVISEIKESARPIILFIDEVHTIIGAGGNGGGGGDAASLLKPALARGELRTIAATTWKEYKKYFEKDAALERRFQPVKVDEPDEKTAIIMLRGLRPRFEEAHGIIITDDAVIAAVRLSSRYISGRQLPDKAVDLLDTCAARVKIALQQKPAALEEAEILIVTLTTELNALRRDADKGIVLDLERISELETARSLAEAKLVSLTISFDKEKAQISTVEIARKKMSRCKTDSERDIARNEIIIALNTLNKSQGDIPLIRPDVDEQMVAQVVAAWTGIPVGKMVQDDVKNLLEMEIRLNRRIKGQYFGINTMAKELRGARAGLKPQNTPQGVFLLVGPSGVGKTETALTIADLMFGGERMMTTINMSEFQEKHTVSRLVGSPPGYVGFGEGGMLTEAVRQRPYTVVLLDECEKADPDVLNLFYQVFDKGMLSDGEGRLVDFKNTVVILTSNLATDIITNMTLAERQKDPTKELDKDPEFMKKLMEAIKPTLVKHFKPALLARMTIVPYLPISPDALGEITKLKLNQVIKRLADNQKIEGSYSDALVKHIADQCTQVDTGARNIDHILRASLLPQMSVAILERIAGVGLPKKMRIDIDQEKNFIIEFVD